MRLIDADKLEKVGRRYEHMFRNKKHSVQKIGTLAYCAGLMILI